MKRWWIALMAGALVLGACGNDDGGSGGQSSSDTPTGGHDGHGGESPPAFEAEAATTTIEVSLQDFTFAGLPSKVTGPNVLVNLKVKGSNQHELAFHNASGHVGGVAPFKAGDEKQLAIVLAPGNYTVQCLVKEGSRTHADLGMKSQVTVE